MPSIFIALIAGLLNIAIFPRIDQGWLALICLFPLFWLVRKERPRRLFLYFWVAGFVFRVGNLYWIIHVIQHYSSLPTLLAASIVLLLCVFMATFWGATGALLGWIRDRKGFEMAMITAPFLWVISEFCLNILQFPWDLLGYSLYRYPAIAQVASVAGVYGLSWLIVAWNASLTLALCRGELYARPFKYYYISSIILIILIALALGLWRISQPIQGQKLKVGIVQGNIPQDVKINYEFAETINKRQIDLTRALSRTNRPDIIFWSESSTLYPLLAGGEWTREVTDLAREEKIPIFIGSDVYTQGRVYNSAFLVDSNGKILPLRYSKMYLVPFGEYVPFQKLLFFAGKVVPEISDFTAGEYHTVFPLNEKKFAVNICFEVVFPQLSRTFCKNGVDLLTTITNDAWFGRSCAPYQHFAMSVMRAIENRRYLVRAANTGISGIVDPYGRVLDQTKIFEPRVLSRNVQWISEKTIYILIGDWILWVSIVFSVFVITVAVRSKVRS